ncbi:MAG: diguanylate cyclase [Fusobacteriota bacterium]
MYDRLNKITKKQWKIVSGVTLILVILNIILFFYFRNILYKRIKSNLEYKVEKIGERIKSGTFFRIKGAAKNLAKDPYIINFLSDNTTNNITNNNINIILRNVKDIYSANTVYLMNNNGLVKASTTYGDSGKTFLKNRYNFRPYFKEAMKGKEYLYGAVGITSKERGFYFSVPVRKGSRVIGVIVIKMDLDQLENVLYSESEKVMLLSPHGVIFASNENDLKFKVLKDKKYQEISEKVQSEVYADMLKDKMEFIKRGKFVEYGKDLYIKEMTKNNLEGRWQILVLSKVSRYIYSPEYLYPFLTGFLFLALFSVIIVIFLIELFYRMEIEKNIRKFSQVIENSPISVVITDPDGNIEYVNPYFEKLTGYSEKEVIGENPRILKSEDKSDKEYKELWNKISKGNTWRGEFYNKKKNGDYYWERAKISSIKDKNGEIEAYIGLKEDITREKRLRKEIEFYAKMDELTAVYNRRAGYDMLSKKIELCSRKDENFSISFLDINNLKYVNDNLGHDFGDKLILNVVEEIKDAIRKSDYIIRFGGDEFIIAFDDSSKKEVERIMERIQKSLDKKNKSEKYNYHMSISYGIEEYDPKDPLDLEKLIFNADEKMYKYKKWYKNKFL